MDSDFRSECPINLTLELLGDRWSLIVIRDLMFTDRRRYRELLGHSVEGIASNILADRLKRLVEAGLLSRRKDPAHKQGVIYSLTEPAIRLVPMMIEIGAWGRRHTLASPAEIAPIAVLENGGPEIVAAFMDELRHAHLDAAKPARAVRSELRAAYDRAVAEMDAA